MKKCCLLVCPETIVFGADFCFTADVLIFFQFQREISDFRPPIGVKFYTMIKPRPIFIMPVQNFGVPFPQKFYGPKIGKIRRDFGRLQTSAANTH